MDDLLKEVLDSRDAIFNQAKDLVGNALYLRSCGSMHLSRYSFFLAKAIFFLENATFDSPETSTLGCHLWAFAYLVQAQFTQEIKFDWELIQRDIQRAINLLSNLDYEAHQSLSAQFKPSTKSTIVMLFYTLDLLSLKGFLNFHFDIYTLINNLCKLENFPLDKCLSLLWSGKRLSHSFCSSTIDPIFLLQISQLFENKSNSITFWIDYLKNDSYFLLMFVQKFFLSASILDKGFIQKVEEFYSLKVTIEDIKMKVSSILLDDYTMCEMTYFSGHLCYDLAERLFASGRVLEALSYAKKALNLRRKGLPKKLIYNKKPIEPAKGEIYYDHLNLFGSDIFEVWQDNTCLDKCNFSHWSILSCYLESILQVGILQEATGNGFDSKKNLHIGKNISNSLSLPYFQVAFSCALAQVNRKMLLWEFAEIELNNAKKILLDNKTMISCKHCKLIFEVTIDMEMADFSLKDLKRGSHVEFHDAPKTYSSVVKKLSDDMVDNSCIASWKQEDYSESFCKIDLEDNKNVVIKNIKSLPWGNERKNFTCNICSFLNNSAQKVMKQISVRETGLPLDKECGESHMQSEIMEKHRNESKIQESCTSSFDSGSSEGGICPSIECLRCFFIKLIKEENMQNIIYFKWQFQRRRLLLRALLKIASGAKFNLNKVQDVFWPFISALFGGKLCFDTNSHGYDLSSFKLMGDNNIGDIFPVERGAFLYTMSWVFLKGIYTEDRRTKCVSPSKELMQDIIPWLLRAFILCRESPVLFQKVSRLIATLILLSTVDESIPQSFFSQQSLSISHWAAFFHQASIGSILNHQYLSFERDKAFFKTYKGQKCENYLESDSNLNISRYTPGKLENLEEFVKEFYNKLPGISVICISLLGGVLKKLLGKVLRLSLDFPSWFLITRFDASNQPIIIFLPAYPYPGIEHHELQEFVCKYQDSVWDCPWSSSEIDNVAPSYRLISEAIFVCMSKKYKEFCLSDIKHWWKMRRSLDDHLNGFLKAMENRWIEPWGCLLMGNRLNAESSEKLASSLARELNSKCDFKVNDNLNKFILSGFQYVHTAEACISQSLLYKGHFGRGGCCRVEHFMSFAKNSEEITSLLPYVQSLVLKAKANDVSDDRQPVILVLDADVQMLPWENMPILKNQEVYRMPSLFSIQQKLVWSNEDSEKRSGFKANLPCIDPFNAYYVLNPSGELEKMQRLLKECFQNLNWEGKSGNVPTDKELLLAFQKYDLYLYFGHGNGLKYIDTDSFVDLDRCAAAFLMGCNSGSLKQCGCYAPRGAPLDYLFAGSPSIIANLWIVSDKDAIRFTKSFLSSWSSECQKALPSSRIIACKTEETAKEHCEEKIKFASFIRKARKSCKYQTLEGASLVCYGVPTILKRKQ